MESALGDENCPFRKMAQKHLVRADFATHMFLPSDGLYKLIVTNIVANLFIASLLFAVFILTFTWVGKHLPLWRQLVEKIHYITCKVEDESAQYSDLHRLPVLTKLRHILFMNREFMLSTCGRDAVHFLLFQRYLFGFTVVIATLVMTITLPVHQLVGLEDDVTKLQSSTLRNLPSHSLGIWLDIVVGTIYLPIALFVMRRFAASLRYFSAGNEVTKVRRTLVLYRLPKRLQEIDALRRWTERNYPGFRVEAINICVSWAKVDSLRYLKNYYTMVLKKCIRYCGCQRYTKIWRLSYCGILFFWWKGDTLAYRYYEQELKRAKKKLRRRFEDINAGKKNLDTAFVTMRTINEAVGMYTFQNLRRRSDKLVTMLYAKAATSIRWRNITQYSFFTCMNLVHWFLLAALVVLFSWPQFIEREVSKMHFVQFFHSFLDSLLNFVVSSLIPIVVLRSTEYLGYWNEARINLELLTKAYVCLLTILFVIPMLNPENLYHLITISMKEARFDYDFRCLFLPDNGVFFFNNLITFAFLGNCVRLCRFTHLFFHFLPFLTSRTLCEAKTVSRYMERETYWIGERTAWNLVHFTIMIGLSLSCPLITLAGLAYLILCHAVDTYLLYKRYYDVPAVDVRTFYHKCITIVLFTTWVLQISTSAFLLSRMRTFTNLTALTLSLLTSMPSALLIAYQNSMGHEGPIEVFRPIKYGAAWRKETDSKAGIYHPPQVLKEVQFPTSTTYYKASE